MSDLKRTLGIVAGLACSGAAAIAANGDSKSENPNIIVVLCDDMGYGDLSCYGSPTIKTPNLDKMASEGQKWSNFYSASSVSTPSRAGLLTGRFPVRSGMTSRKRGVLYDDSEGGLPASEITIAEALKTKGYATACIGKWHVGNIPKYSPLKNGFDYYYGLPYSNDMNLADGYTYYETAMNPKPGVFKVGLIENDKIIENPVDQTTLTKRYTEHVIDFIKQNKNHPFFIYMAHSMPHVPLHRSTDFVDVSAGGIYGDVIEEIDWSMGEIIKSLRELNLDENTLVVFTSDNGPWTWFKDHGGSPGPLRGAKMLSWEAGNRVPAIFWQPGFVNPGVITDMGASVDFLPTFCALANVEIPSDRTLDGFDLTGTLTRKAPAEREDMFFYKGDKLVACRHGNFKLHFFDTDNADKEVTELYDLAGDPGEKYNLANKYPDLVKSIRAIADAHVKTVVPVVNQLEFGWTPEGK